MIKNKETTVEVGVSRAIDHFWRPIFISLTIMGLCFAGYLAYSAYQTSLEKAAQEKLFSLQKRVEEKKEAIEKSEKEKNPETLQKNYGDILKDYDTFIARETGKKASYIAAIQVAGLALTYKDLSLAEKSLSSVAGIVKPNDIFYGLIKSQLGAVLMDLKKYQEAANQYEILAEEKSQTYFHPYALLRLGVCYIELGDFEKAEVQFSKLLAAHPSTQAANEAKNMKKLVALRRGSNK